MDRKDPKLVLETFLLALGNKQWDAMVSVSQTTWRSTRDNPVEEIEALLGWMDLMKFRVFAFYPVHHESIPKGAMLDAKCFVEYRTATGSLEQRNVLIRLACESDTYKPDPKGEWGVNPISVRDESLSQKPEEKKG